MHINKICGFKCHNSKLSLASTFQTLGLTQNEINVMQGLDELQSYVLLRRWLQDEGDILTGDGLTYRQRSSVQAAYSAERNSIFSCLGCLLQAKEGEVHHKKINGEHTGNKNDQGPDAACDDW